MANIEEHELSVANGSEVDLDSNVGPFVIAKGSISDESELAADKASAALRLPEIIIYEHINFGGRWARTNLNWYYVGRFWNDRISSIIVVSGTWRFYEHWHYEGRYFTRGPGYYSRLPMNDVISSFKVLSV